MQSTMQSTIKLNRETICEMCDWFKITDALYDEGIVSEDDTETLNDMCNPPTDEAMPRDERDYGMFEPPPREIQNKVGYYILELIINGSDENCTKFINIIKETQPELLKYMQ